MTDLFNLISSISGTPAPAAPPARQAQAANVPKPAPRPAGTTNGAPQPPSLKRKAEGLLAGNEVKIQRKNTPPVDRASATARPAAVSDAGKPKPAAPTTAVPYRGTAGGSGPAAKPPPMTKKPTVAAGSATTLSKPASATPLKSPGAAPTGAIAAAPKKGSYAEILAKAKQAQQSKPPTPPVKHEPAKILTKKERLALKAEAKEGTKGKKSGNAGLAKATDSKGVIGKEKARKPVETGYQGTARPAKKPVEVGYKGTAKPATATGPVGLAGRNARYGPSKSKTRQQTPDSWLEDDLGEEEDQEDYYSDESDDMEGGIWDVYEEEERALKSAKKEDAEYLREEMEAKRAKEERKRKLLAMNKAAAAKRKY